MPFLALWGTRYLSISHPLIDFLADCATGRLPQVSFVDPRFVDENSGTSGDDHPHGDVRAAEYFLSTIYNAVTTGPAWSKTLLIINFNEWGGFFDHVPPLAAPIPPADQQAGNTVGLRGFRVPSLMISPWSERGYVSHTLYDHTSVLKLIEWRWRLRPLTIRDATANNPASDLNFASPNLTALPSMVPAFVSGTPCPPNSPATGTYWQELQSLATRLGFPTG